MSDNSGALDELRQRISQIDDQILELLTERSALARSVVKTKVEHQLPVFVPEREDAKTADFRQKASDRGLDPDWAEDFLRMIMTASRATQSMQRFPRATREPRRILFIGGEGRMGQLYRATAARSGHEVFSIDQDNWYELEALAPDLDLVIITVPIKHTLEVIARLQGRLSEHTVLADFTSNKAAPLAAMLQAHSGPVLALHPMHGPDVKNLSKQLMVVCPGRKPEQAAWFIDQCRLWGMRIMQADAEQHDQVMHLVQGLRHFVALLHGSFMRHHDLKPADMLDYSSPIYRAEMMMTGRIFAQSPELYADIVFASEARRQLLLDFFSHHERLADMVRNNDRAGFIREFEQITDFFGRFASQALEESGYLIHRLADRFA